MHLAFGDIAHRPLAHGVVAGYRAATGLDVRRRLVKRYELDYYVDEKEKTVTWLPSCTACRTGPRGCSTT